MSPTDAARVRAYVATLPPRARRAMKQLRSAIRSALPGAVEAFSYRIPAFRVRGRVAIWYAAFREHCSVYPLTPDVRRRFAKELKGYKVATGTVRFPLDKPMPVALVKRLVKAKVNR